MSAPLEAATLGEGLVVLDPLTNGPLRHVAQFAKRLGGAEVNVAVALARLGHHAAWAGALGDDEFGRELLAFLRGEGLDTSGVRLDPAAPTGIYFKERRSLGRLQVAYYRAGSAASRMGPEDVDVDGLLRAGLLHLTGITPAVSEGCRALVDRLTAAAVERGVTLSFDANVRRRLLGGRDARELLEPFAARADLLFCSEEEAELLLGGADPGAVQRAREGLRAEVVVVHEAGGAFAVHDGGVTHAAGHEVAVVDTVGAGDAFVAGFLSGRLRGWDVAGCLALANACGACAVTVPGDVESMPTEREVLPLLDGRREVER